MGIGVFRWVWQSRHQGQLNMTSETQIKQASLIVSLTGENPVFGPAIDNWPPPEFGLTSEVGKPGM
jgi:hypothetical protein